MSKVDILLNLSHIVGSITLKPAATALPSKRTASGFRIEVPASVVLRTSHDKIPLLLEDLAVTFFDFVENIEIGTARFPETLCTNNMDRQINLAWDWTVSAMVHYERLRDGKEPHFGFVVTGAIRPLFQHGNYQLCSIPETFRSEGNMRYSREAWTNTLRSLKFRDSILVEIPFSSEPPNGWDSVWNALRDARNAFDTGGSTGWKGTVTSVRLALEEWRKIEKEDQGPGDFKSRTKDQRIDVLRWSLMQYSHFAPHSRADEWTRDDALLALSTLSALLANRKP